jgi:cobalamin biosynthesis protein CobW
MVLLTKSDCVSEADRAKVQQWLNQEVPTGVKIVPVAQGVIPPDVLLGFNAAVEDDLDNRHSHHDHEEEHEHDEEINAVQIITPQTFDVNELINRLKTLVQSQEIYRIKGFVAVPNKAMRLVVQGVGQRFDSFYDRAWQPNEIPQTKLVIIGNGLDQAQIQASICG